jgi:hypothetical protein
MSTIASASRESVCVGKRRDVALSEGIEDGRQRDHRRATGGWLLADQSASSAL